MSIPYPVPCSSSSVLHLNAPYTPVTPAEGATVRGLYDEYPSLIQRYEEKQRLLNLKNFLRKVARTSRNRFFRGKKLSVG